MKNNKVVRRISINISLIILYVMLIAGMSPTLAADSLKVSLPYSHTFKTEYTDVDNAFCYDLVPMDGSPIQSRNNEVWISGYGTTTGSIPLSFENAGTYQYTLSASQKYRKEGYTYEDETYIITITVKESRKLLELTSLIIQGSDKYKYSAIDLDPAYSRANEPDVSPSAPPTEEPDVTPSISPSDNPQVSPSAAPTNSPYVSPGADPNGGGTGKNSNGGSSGTSGNGKGQSNTNGSPKTGDETPLAVLIVMAFFSVFMVVFLVWWDRHEEKRKGDKT